MNILITGGLGYIGSKLLDTLNSRYKITVVDNLYTQRYCSLYNREKEFVFIEDDFDNLDKNFIRQFDVVIHLAAIVDAANSNKQSKLVNEVNVLNTLEFFKKCYNINLPIIFPSSTSVYGSSTKIVYEDDDSLVNPQSEYAKSKLIVEKWLKKRENFHYSILRFGTVSGISPGMRFQTCVNKFCYQATFNMPITVWKTNKDMLRPYLSLGTVAKLINYMLENWQRYSRQTYNVVTENLSPINIIDIIKKYKKDVKINYVDCPLLNQFSYIVSNNKILNTQFYDNENNITTDICNTLKMFSNKI